MKRFLIVLFFIFSLLSKSEAQLLCDIDEKPFLAGEILHYQLFYNFTFVWIQAGTCEFRVRSAVWDKKQALELSLLGQSQKSFDRFFKIRDSIVSYVDKDRLVPFKSTKYTHEDNWHGMDDFTFKEENNGWRVTTRLKRKDEWKPSSESITLRCGFDIVTTLYRIRSLSDERLFVKGRKTEIPVRLEDDEYNLYLTYLGKSRIKLHGGGSCNAHAFSLTMIEGAIFKRGDVLKMWISDDGNKIPLMVESPIRVGSVKAIFRSAENALYPLEKIESK